MPKTQRREPLLGCAPPEHVPEEEELSMTKSEFIEKIAGDERIDSKKAASDAVEAVLDGIVGSLTCGR